MPTPARTYPAFPIPAVGAVIIEQQHIVLVRRGRPPAEGQWTIPGGVVELGEAPEDAVAREVAEECGLEAQALGLLDVVSRIVRDGAGAVQYHYVILEYLARRRHVAAGQGLPDLVVRADADVCAARWAPLREVSNYAVTEGLGPIIQAGIRMQAQWELSRNTEDYQ